VEQRNTIDEEVEAHRDDHRRNSRVVVALLSGDSDFSFDVRKLNRHWYNVVMLYAAGRANRAMLDEVGPGNSCGNWNQLLALCSGATPTVLAVVPPPVPEVPLAVAVHGLVMSAPLHGHDSAPPRRPAPLRTVELSPAAYEFLTRFPKLLADAVQEASGDACFAMFSEGSASVFARASVTSLPSVSWR
jgi:hypothetical protein